MTREYAAQPFEPTPSGRLLVRRPSPDDLDVVFRVHADPRTNVHNPAGPPADLGAAAAHLEGWLEHWRQHGFGYWTVQLAAGREAQRPGELVGFAGLRHDVWLGRPVLNLYYRLAPEHWGHGYATELARFALGSARRMRPDLLVVARTRPDNVASQRTALAAGMVRRPDLEVDDEAGHVVVLASRPAGPQEP
ncbi:GNAT family N-acetyltransferase [Georgenia daeguensis]|uniref:GNAT family N-acetyltransferase n=1 Tax=Georgenia daeguensis TaxID=908355 RepID=A0ABP6ULH9_9MICO